MYVFNKSVLKFYVWLHICLKASGSNCYFSGGTDNFYSILIYEIVYLEKFTPFPTVEHLSIHNYNYCIVSSYSLSPFNNYWVNEGTCVCMDTVPSNGTSAAYQSKHPWEDLSSFIYSLNTNTTVMGVGIQESCL